MKGYFFALCFVLSCANGSCQTNQALKQRYDSLVILQLTDTRYSLNGEKLGTGQFKNALLSYSESGKEYSSYGKKKAISIVLIAGAGVFLISSAVLGPQNLAAGVALLAAAFGSDLVAVPFAINSRKHLRRSVWTYNRSAICGERPDVTR